MVVPAVSVEEPVMAATDGELRTEMPIVAIADPQLFETM
jgi:hypothetical protein